MKNLLRTITMVAVLAGVSQAFAASVEPVAFDPWDAGDAESECTQAGLDCDWSYKIDEWDASIDGEYPADGGNVITISNNNGESFDWTSEYPVCAVIVKGGPVANVYYYDGAFGDTELFAPINPNNGKPYGISHVTFCYNDPDFCYQEETAWTAGSRYVSRGNWAMYTAYSGVEKTVNIIAGQTTVAGTATFSAPVDGMVTITINLTGGCIFYYDQTDPVADNNLKVQDYAKAPTGNPAPGLFAWKASFEPGSTTGSIVVPVNNFYGVHLDIACPVPCE